MITETGLFPGVDESTYHADSDLSPKLGRSLSASGAKTLLHSPERFAYEREHGRPGTRAMDLGTVAHALVLGNPDRRLLVVDAYDWRTKAAKDAKAQGEKDGRVVVHRGDLAKAARIARAVKRHPLAGPIFSEGQPEVSLYWIDEATGVTCRGRVDWLRDNAIVDLKTVGRYGGTELGTFGRQAASLDYPMSAAHYTDGIEALTGKRLPFITVAVEVEPPHFVTVGWYDDADLQTGRDRMRRALEIYAERESSGQWVDPPEIQTIPIPRYYQ